MVSRTCRVLLLEFDSVYTCIGQMRPLPVFEIAGALPWKWFRFPEGEASSTMIVI